jgi:archaellum component FlaC
MPTADDSRLQTIQTELNAILEDRITQLMAHIKAAQGVSREIARTEDEIRRQQALKEQLGSELGPMRSEAESLKAETAQLQEEVDGLLASISKMRSIREELLSMKGSQTE